MALWFQKRRLKTDNTLFTPFGHLVSFVYLSTNIFSRGPSKERSYQCKFGSNWPNVVSENIKNRQQLIYPYWPSCFLCTSDQQNLFRGLSNEHSYHVWFQFALWFQKRILKTDNTLLTPLHPCFFHVPPFNKHRIPFLEVHPMNLPIKFASNWPSGFGEF